MTDSEWDVESNVTTLPEYTSERGSLRSYTSLLIASGDPRYRFSTDGLSLAQLPPLPVAAAQSYQPPRVARPLPSLPAHNQLTEPPSLPRQAQPIEVPSIQTATEESNNRRAGASSIISENSIVPLDEPTEPTEAHAIFTLEHPSTSFSSYPRSPSQSSDIDDPKRTEVVPIMPSTGTIVTTRAIEAELEVDRSSRQPSSQHSRQTQLLQKQAARKTSKGGNCLCKVLFSLVILAITLVAFLPIVAIVLLVMKHVQRL